MLHRNGFYRDQTPERVADSIRVLGEFADDICTLLRDRRLLVMGVWAQKVWFGFCDVHLGKDCDPFSSSIIEEFAPGFLDYTTWWSKPELTANNYEVLARAFPNFWSFERFNAYLKDTHVTSKMLAATMQTIEWVKHLPASDIQKAAASETGKRTWRIMIAKCKERGRTERQNQAAAANSRTKRARASASVSGSTVGVENFKRAREDPNWRRSFLDKVTQFDFDTVVNKAKELLAENESACLLDLAHYFAKQEGHLKDNCNKAAEKTNQPLPEALRLILEAPKPPESVLRARVQVEQAQKLWKFVEGGFTHYSISHLNPSPVTPGVVRQVALGLTDKQYKAAMKSRESAVTDEGLRFAAVTFSTIPAERLAVICKRNGESVSECLLRVQAIRGQCAPRSSGTVSLPQ
jgi:hypothetical protein